MSQCANNKAVLFISPRKTSPVCEDWKLVQKLRTNVSVPALTILGVLEAAGFETHFLDVTTEAPAHIEKVNKQIVANGLSDEETIKRAVAIQPKFILIPSLFTFDQEVVDSLVRAIKKALPNNVYVVLGGTHASTKPEWHFEESDPDVIVIGEGEATIVELLKELSAPEPDLARIRGIAYRDSKGGIRKTEPSGRLMDLNYPWAYETVIMTPDCRIRYLDRHSRKSPIYFSEVTGDNAPCFTFLGSRGCVGTCKYCTTSRKYDRRILHMGAESMYRQFLKMRRDFNVSVFTNQADAFGVHAEDIRFLEMVQDYRQSSGDHSFILNNPNAFYLWSFFRGYRYNELRHDFLDLLSGSGFNVITLAVETLNQRFNDKVDCQLFSPKKIVELCQEIHLRGMKIEIYMMCCFPEQTYEEFAKDLKLAERLRPVTDQISWNWLSLLPGTVFYEQNIEQTGKEQAYRRIIRDGYGCYNPVEELNLSEVPINYYKEALAPYGQAWI
ncbi:MAG TPA: B12-binding domain-containing radical SAM protein [Candidatus Wunengus sp. YC63]|uniref:B12-binding domain-containing radical SAM protein n=1 Tax=Candidatus Wunengus sp. YC63 TaxID=3367699 RepID=UPI004026B610